MKVSVLTSFVAIALSAASAFSNTIPSGKSAITPVFKRELSSSLGVGRDRTTGNVGTTVPVSVKKRGGSNDNNGNNNGAGGNNANNNNGRGGGNNNGAGNNGRGNNNGGGGGNNGGNNGGGNNNGGHGGNNNGGGVGNNNGGGGGNNGGGNDGGGNGGNNGNNNGGNNGGHGNNNNNNGGGGGGGGNNNGVGGYINGNNNNDSDLNFDAINPNNINDINRRDLRFLNLALLLEDFLVSFFERGLSRYSQDDFQRAGYPNWVRGRYEQICEHEKKHREYIQSAITSGGGDYIRSCRYEFSDDNVRDFIETSEALETIAASAYTGSLQYFHDRNYITAGATILAVEARHAAFINGAVRKQNPERKNKK